MTTYRIKRMSKTYLPESITHLGKEFKRVCALNIDGAAKELQANGNHVIVLSVLSKNLKGRTDLHGNPYKPTQWVFVA